MYARPSRQLSPGDIFLEIPFTVGIAPLRVARTHSYTPKAGHGPALFRQIFVLPEEQANLKNPALNTAKGEETIGHTRVSKAMLLTWGSEVDAVERSIATRQGRPGNRTFLAVPVFPLTNIPENQMEEDPDTHEKVPIRELIRRGRLRDAFYLRPFPAPHDQEHFAELRKVTPIGVKYFFDAKPDRIVALLPQALNDMYSQLLWSLTRAELFFRPVRCQNCGQDVPIDIKIEGQNFDLEPL